MPSGLCFHFFFRSCLCDWVYFFFCFYFFFLLCFYNCVYFFFCFYSFFSLSVSMTIYLFNLLFLFLYGASSISAYVSVSVASFSLFSLHWCYLAVSVSIPYSFSKFLFLLPFFLSFNSWFSFGCWCSCHTCVFWILTVSVNDELFVSDGYNSVAVFPLGRCFCF